MVDKLAIARQYLKARMAEDHATALSLVTDDISLSTPKDGTYSGKDAFSQYLKTVKPVGKWEEPVLDGERVKIKGAVPVKIVTVHVVLHLDINSEGKIKKIELEKKKEARKK